MNINKKNLEINRMLKSKEFSTKIYLYFSTKSVGEDYDSEEKNYTFTNLNPHVVKGYVREVKAEALVWKQYGLSETGAKEVICEYKFAEWFRLANKIEIDGDSYEVYKENIGNRCLIEKRPFSLCRIILRKKI